MTTNAEYAIINTEIKGCDLTAEPKGKKGNTMTQKEFYTEVLNNETLSADAHEIAQKWLDKDNERNAEKRAAREGLLETVRTLLADATEPMTATAIATAVGISTPKATSLAKDVEGVKVGEIRVGNRFVKTYSL